MSENFIKVALKSDLSEGKIIAVELHGEKIALCQTGNSYYAVGDTCSHAKVKLDGGQIVDGQIECPKHGARFDLQTGKATCPPAIQPIPTYSIEVRGEELWLAGPKNN